MISMPSPSLVLDTPVLSLGQFRADVLRGLRATPKELPCKYFYDDAGSALFEKITDLEEYYLTRTEAGIMQRHAPEMTDLFGPRCLLIEYGSGSSAKTRYLLDNLLDPVGYVPVDVSRDFLNNSAETLAEEYPQLDILPVCADFCQLLKLPEIAKFAERRVVYFPGSTIGNFNPGETLALLRRTAELCGPGGGLLLGADLRKDQGVLEAAYNDAAGITAAFNRNIMDRINRELNGDFVPRQFDHRAFYNAKEGRIEMHLISRQAQQARVDGDKFTFFQGESIRTECSYKFNLEYLNALAKAAGFTSKRVWMDERKYFSVIYFTVSA